MHWLGTGDREVVQAADPVDWRPAGRIEQGKAIQDGHNRRIRPAKAHDWLPPDMTPDRGRKSRQQG